MMRRPGWWLLAAVVWAPLTHGCDSGRAPRPITAELLDDRNPDGVAGHGERIRITLDRPLSRDFRPEKVRAWIGPPRTLILVRPAGGGPGAEVLDLELLANPPQIQTAGSFSGDPAQEGPGPTGLGIDLGPPAPGEQWVDLQERRPYPNLVRALWEDRPVAGARGGNLVVDQGDWIRLYFDQDVRLEAAGGEPVPARVPADLLLTEPGDRLDDGSVQASFAEGDGPRELKVILGSNPRLTIAGRHRPGSERSLPFRSSGIALNGTPVEPLRTIVDRRGWPGAISRGSVDIEFPPDYAFFEKSADQAFPEPGRRADHTVTPVAFGRAVIAGGRSSAGKAVAQVLLFDPGATRPLSLVGELAEPCYLHTATLLAGEDGRLGSLDDFVVIAGGTDGDQSLPSLTAVRLESDPGSAEGLSLEPLPHSLDVPRMQHTATFIPPNRLLIEGGRYSGPSGRGGIVATAEILSFEVRGGKIAVRKEGKILLFPRMRHSSTYLGVGIDGVHYVFTHGGVGIIPRDRSVAGGLDPAQPLFSPDEGVVLSSPTLIRLEPSRAEVRGQPPPSGSSAREVEVPLDFEYRFEMMRFDHRSAPVGFDPYSARDGSPRQVLIAGGSLHPPSFDPDRPGRKLFEPPRRAEDGPLFLKGPSFLETAAALILEFHPAEPSRSTLSVVESSTGDRRIHFALVPLTHPGVMLILGGENPERPGEIYSSGEVYLAQDRRLLPLAVPLAAPRTRLGAFVAEGAGSTVYVLGGISPLDETQFADVERLRMHFPLD